VTGRPSQFGGGTPFGIESGGEVSKRGQQNPSSMESFIRIVSLVLLALQLAGERYQNSPGLESVTTTNCDSVPDRGQQIGERGGSLARRRYQKGRVFLRGIKNPVWVGRWREDEIKDGRICRIERSEVLGSKSDFPTKRLALRELEKRLSVVNDPRYRARPTSTFADFAVRWESLVLSQYKLSTQVTIKSHLRKHHVPFFGHLQMKDIYPEEVQRFISSANVSAKTKKNLFATMQMLWKSARAWGYVAHDAVSEVVLPKRQRSAQRFFSVEEIQRLLEAAPEPYLTLFWIAAETGMRAGELCGLRLSDFDLGRRLVRVNRGVWRGKVQSTKSEHRDRCFALSPLLCAHLAEFFARWTPNESGWLFATRLGTPWDQNLVAKRKLYPLLESLGIERGGLHAFRHANITLMDRLGVPLKLRHQRVGHSEGSLTLDVYTHVASEDDVRFAEQLGAILRPNAPKSKKEGVVPFGQPLVN
jgi:integrase